MVEGEQKEIGIRQERNMSRRVGRGDRSLATHQGWASSGCSWPGSHLSH